MGLDVKTPEQEQANQVAAEAVQVEETRALKSGWRPKNEFKGDERRWRPADKWNERADEIMPIMKAENHQLSESVSDLQKQVAESTDTMTRMVKMQQKTMEDTYSTRKADLEAKQLQAVEDQNTEAFQALKVEENKLEKPEPIPEPETQTTENQNEPTTQGKKWMDENSSWFGANPEMTDFAVLISANMEKNGTLPATEVEQQAVINAKIQAAFPEHFKNPNQERQAVMDDPSIRGTEFQNNPPGGKSWNDIPELAQRQALIDIGTDAMPGIPGMTKEQWAKTYWEDDE